MPTPVRILAAALSGYGIAIGVASIGAFLAGAAFPQSAAPPTTPYLAISVAIGFLGAVAGGYVCSRIAPDNRRLVTMALLILLFLGMTVAATRLGQTDARQPFGFLPLVTLLAVVGAWAGAMTERAIHSPLGGRRHS